MPAPEPTTSASSDDIPTRIRAVRGNFVRNFGTFDLRVWVQDRAKADIRFASSKSRITRYFTRLSRENAQAFPPAEVARKGW